MGPTETRPLVLALTSDLFIVPRLQDVCRRIGFDLMVVDNPAALGAQGPPRARQVPLTEPLEGPDAVFIEKIVELLPALLLVDLDSKSIPWERWIQTLKTSAASRRIPILAFGPHVQQHELAAAERAGADQVLPRGAAVKSLARLIKQWARVADEEGLRQGCRGALSRLGMQGVELLNAGMYFEAHEVLEHAWMEAPELEGYLYRALLQVCVSYLHVERNNFRGAMKMLLRLRQWLEPLPDECRGVDLHALRVEIQEFRQALEAAGPGGLPQLDRALLRPIPLRPR